MALFRHRSGRSDPLVSGLIPATYCDDVAVDRRRDRSAAMARRARATPQAGRGDGNKRLALAAVIAFYGVNGRRVALTNDEPYQLVVEVAAGHFDSVDDIAARLRTATDVWPPR